MQYYATLNILSADNVYGALNLPNGRYLMRADNKLI